MTEREKHFENKAKNTVHWVPCENCEVLPPKAAELDAAMSVAEHLLLTVFILPRVAANLAKKNKPADP